MQYIDLPEEFLDEDEALVDLIPSFLNEFTRDFTAALPNWAGMAKRLAQNDQYEDALRTLERRWSASGDPDDARRAEAAAELAHGDTRKADDVSHWQQRHLSALVQGLVSVETAQAMVNAAAARALNLLHHDFPKPIRSVHSSPAGLLAFINEYDEVEIRDASGGLVSLHAPHAPRILVGGWLGEQLILRMPADGGLRLQDPRHPNAFQALELDGIYRVKSFPDGLGGVGFGSKRWGQVEPKADSLTLLGSKLLSQCNHAAFATVAGDDWIALLSSDAVRFVPRAGRARRKMLKPGGFDGVFHDWGAVLRTCDAGVQIFDLKGERVGTLPIDGAPVGVVGSQIWMRTETGTAVVDRDSLEVVLTSEDRLLCTCPSGALVARGWDLGWLESCGTFRAWAPRLRRRASISDLIKGCVDEIRSATGPKRVALLRSLQRRFSGVELVGAARALAAAGESDFGADLLETPYPGESYLRALRDIAPARLEARAANEELELHLRCQALDALDAHERKQALVSSVRDREVDGWMRFKATLLRIPTRRSSTSVAAPRVDSRGTNWFGKRYCWRRP